MKIPSHPNSRLLFRALSSSILALSLWALSSVPAYGQEYLRMIESGQYSVQEVQQSAEAFFQDRFQGRGSGYKQYKRWEYNALRMMDESGYLKPQSYYIQEWERMNAARNQNPALRSTTDDFWEDMGPTYWNASSGWNPGVGRITSFTVDPDDHSHIIIGAHTGGVWKTLDRGQNWLPLCDFFANMTVFSTAMHPQDKDTYYFGSENGRIYKSTDGGAVWNALAQAGNATVNKLLIHPEHPDTIFASVEGSGFFRTLDGGLSWTRITEDPTAFDLKFKPGDLNTIYAAGSAFHKSVDGGATFTSTETVYPFTILGDAPISGNYLITDNGFSPGKVPIPVAPDGIQAPLVLYEDGESNLGCEAPLNPEELNGSIAIVRRGGCTFASKVLNAQFAGARAVIVVNNVSGSVTMGGGDADIEVPAVSIDMETGEAIIAALSDGQALEAKLEISLSGSFTTEPKMLGVSQADPERVYLLEASNRAFGALYLSTDAGGNFERLDHEGKNYFGYSTEAADDRGQAPRDMGIAVNPFNADEVHIAGILTWRSMDGGLSFECTSDWIPNAAQNKGIGYCHADVDAMDFVDSLLYVGTDGGIFYAEETELIRPDYYTDLTEGLGIRQFYKIGISQTDPVIVSGGSQDNGTSVYSQDGIWTDWLGADGMETFIDKDDPNFMYGTTQFGRLYFSFNGGMDYYGLVLPGSERGNWVTPFEQDPVLPSTIYVGYEEVYQSGDGGESWVPISQTFPEKLDHLKIAPSNPDVMYCAYQNRLFRTTTGPGTWQSLSGYSGRINSIAIHPQDPLRIAIATNSSGKVYVSEDGGDNWEIYRKNLPDFSALALVWHEFGLYVGMNYGIYFIEDSSNFWIPFDSNLPNVIINELEINYADNKLYAATYGRGLWASDLYNPLPSAAKQEALTENLRVFPNPTNGPLQVQWEAAAGQPTTFELYNAQGKLLSYTKEQTPEEYRLDLRSFPEGIYFLRMGNAKGRVTAQVTKQ